MRVVPFEPWHFEFCVNLTPTGQIYGLEGVRMLAHAYYTRGYAESALSEDGRIIGCGGVLHLWHGVGEVWSAYTDEFLQHPKDLIRITKSLLARCWNGMHLHRMQATVIHGDPVKERFIEHLGFRKESVMEQMCADRGDMGMWVRVRD